MNYAAEKILHELRAARQARGLSQRELGELMGLPQSNIARFESGTMDPGLSKIIELARALDLDIKLIPRKALSAVEGTLRASDMSIDPGDATSRALYSLRQVQDALGRLAPGFEPPEDLEETLAALERLRFDQAQFAALQDILKRLRRTISQLQIGDNPPLEWRRRLREGNARLRDLRNQIAHGAQIDRSHFEPAFSLENDDDD